MIGIITSALAAVGSVVASSAQSSYNNAKSKSSSRRSSVSLSGTGKGYNEASCYSYNGGNMTKSTTSNLRRGNRDKNGLIGQSVKHGNYDFPMRNK